jgi:uncharacterized protein
VARGSFRKLGLVALTGHPRLVRHAVESPRWPHGRLTVAVLSDIHVSTPWVTPAALRHIVGMVNDLGADLILLPGDFIADRKMPGRHAPMAEIAPVLAHLAAPLGVFAVMGNHDWSDCAQARATRFRESSVAEGLAAAGIPLMRNEARLLGAGGAEFWLVGFDSQRPHGGRRRLTFHRPGDAFGPVPEGAPAILMAHEPDYFAEGDARAFLQVSGHTHGGQMNLFGWRPLTPSRYGSRYAWGHMRDGDRHLVVSGGIGFSGLPVRLFQPPEITLITVTGA